MATEHKESPGIIPAKRIGPNSIMYEYQGYTIRVHFNGTKTFVECLRNLAERRLNEMPSTASTHHNLKK